MLRTSQEIQVEPKDTWKNVKSSIVERFKQEFCRYPNCFFTEHDIHSVLYSIAKEELKQNGILAAGTLDEHQVILVHHEYPTPFRCDMKKYGFQLKDEKPYKRGHYDLVVLNPEFVRSHKLDVVCGKDYETFRTRMQEVKAGPLVWACEVIFFPGVQRLPKNALKIILQDALKVKETLRFQVGKNIQFCRMGSVLVFTSHTSEKTLSLKEQVAELRSKLELEVVLCQAS